MNKKLVKMNPSPAESTISTRAEKKQVEERLAIGPHVVYETIRREGEEELSRTASALAWSALAAGLSMGFSFIADGLLASRLPDQPWRPLVTRAGYCVGFLIVILGRQQLFTENTLTVVLPLLLKKTCRHCCACCDCGPSCWRQICLELSCSLCASGKYGSSMPIRNNASPTLARRTWELVSGPCWCAPSSPGG